MERERDLRLRDLSGQHTLSSPKEAKKYEYYLHKSKIFFFLSNLLINRFLVSMETEREGGNLNYLSGKNFFPLIKQV